MTKNLKTMAWAAVFVLYLLYAYNCRTRQQAAIQRRGSILAWMGILSVYGADTIAIDLSLSALIS
jgi:hypothetical protein